jgi:serine/threonine protein kinase
MGLQYLHSLKILHRDLKTQNIFLTRNRKNNKQHIKLGDLGIARELTTESELATTMIGTPCVAAVAHAPLVAASAFYTHARTHTCNCN